MISSCSPEAVIVAMVYLTNLTVVGFPKERDQLES